MKYASNTAVGNAVENINDDGQFTPAVGVETEDDLTSLDPSLLGKAVVSSTDWTAETTIAQLAKGNISLDPIFQRRDAWTQSGKSKFIESIIWLPIPQVVLAESPEKKGAFIVIDGKQRLLTLQHFGANTVAAIRSPKRRPEPWDAKRPIGFHDEFCKRVTGVTDLFTLIPQ